MLTDANTRALLVDDVANLLVQPAINQAVAGAPAVSTTVTISGATFRIPIQAGDPSASWVAEGQEIPITDATLTELDVTPAKLAALSIITSELANDSSPAAAQVVGQGMARDLARKIDTAYFGALPAPAPAGLSGLSGIQTVVNAGAFGDLDAFSTAISLAENVGATVTAFLMGPTTALAMAKIRDETGSNRPLLGSGTYTDGTTPTQRMIRGVPVLVSAAIPANTAWAVDSSRTWMVVRSDASILVDGSVFFTSDRVAVRATMRCGFAFPHPQSVIKITVA